jgi:nanoRNase/pAp phosphatase (c-di-AMP/oligoRNAs hydrolase)
MTQIQYERIEVIGEQQATFDLTDARALALAVEHLAKTEPGKLAWLSVSTTLTLGTLRSTIVSLLTYDQLQDKTEAEIWKMLDANTRKNIETVKRSRRNFGDLEH